ncbi:MAG: hypothetical protein MHMPM18_001739 [Marteilia pararefringens]
MESMDITYFFLLSIECILILTFYALTCNMTSSLNLDTYLFDRETMLFPFESLPISNELLSLIDDLDLRSERLTFHQFDNYEYQSNAG